MKVSHRTIPVDPAQEIARLRHSINLLEAHIFPTHHRHISPSSNSGHPNLFPQFEDSEDPGVNNSSSAILASHSGGFYAGPTSAATHLMNEFQDGDGRQSISDNGADNHSMAATHEYDRDLLNLLPSFDIIDQLIDYYFEYCNWIHRHIDQPTFTQAWSRFKGGMSPDRIVLATVCVLLAVAVQYLPAEHIILESIAETHEDLGYKYYDVMRSALQRQSLEPRVYTLELVELLLLRAHFQSLCKTDSEEMWIVKGELMSIALAMGLHRDPDMWHMPRQLAERRRWCWWGLIALDRWQSFLFGRPVAIASHHFDTQMPSDCEPSFDITGRSALPYLASFRLAAILGDIMNDAVSLRPVPYETVLAHDRALAHWMDALPEELDMDGNQLTRSLASHIPAIRRLGVQSLINRTCFHHIRFTLHRPYTSSVGRMSSRTTSFEAAVEAANQVITLIGHSRADLLANPSFTAPGHLSMGSFHVFSAAMFFCFQLISDPDQPNATMFRNNIQKAMAIIDRSREFSIAGKAYAVLEALAPLYSAEFPRQSMQERGKQKVQVLAQVRTLAFPYHDAPRCHFSVESNGSTGTGGSPTSRTSSSRSPDLRTLQPPTSSMRDFSQPQQLSCLPPYTQPPLPSLDIPDSILLQDAQPDTQFSSFDFIQQSLYPQPPHVVPAKDDDMLWSSSLGFGPSEWTSFLEVMQHSV
ncbi:hypothetical protein FIBSPDRAFT_140494 [Athelia psychrophila]|uniref:Xylanolytic transcriptional activator regulatory domain-containing protein n=1 Tax=Athelia psychrophila TaxID=1759441 RepID=A0A166BX94_9AGAM|nr:hypothetical protein FIBSPDRAFT_140494 [Fibularhizoctonia sp. CBS 109695]